MLVQFSVANFRSFNEERSLNLAASNYFTELPENTFKPNKRKKLSLLKAIGIYGANASGKTSLLSALGFMDRQVLKVERSPNEKINTSPFKLSSATLKEPSQFEVIFIEGEREYQYGFRCTAKAFVGEWLFVDGKAVLKRHFNEQTQEFEYAKLNLSDEDLVGVDGWKKFASNPNTLFVPKAASNGSHLLKPVLDWFENRLVVANTFSDRHSLEQLDNPEWNEKILGFLHQMGLSDIKKLDSRPFDMAKLSFPNEVPKEIQERLRDDFKSRKEVVVKRNLPDGEGFAEFNLLTEESDGTRELFAFAYPLLDILDRDGILVVDEIDNSLHPLVVQQMVRYFQNKCPNSKAQLVFTTHDASLLSKNLLRRDQVWFTEKNPELATDLYSLEQFSPRRDEAIEKRYLSGRYGGIPIMSHLDYFHE